MALPDSTRHQPEREFEHFEPEPVDIDCGEMLVFLGRLGEGSSPVHTHTPLLGAEIRLDPGAAIDLPVDPRFEHGLLVDSGDIALENVDLPVASIGYTGIGVDELRIANHGDEPGRLILIGGEPFTEEIVMWWNFVGRTHEEIVRYREEWQAEGDRFGASTATSARAGPVGMPMGWAGSPRRGCPTSRSKRGRIRPRRSRAGPKGEAWADSKDGVRGITSHRKPS